MKTKGMILAAIWALAIVLCTNAGIFGQTFYFHNNTDLTDTFLNLMEDPPPEGSFWFFDGADEEYPDNQFYDEVEVSALKEAEGDRGTLWTGMSSWLLTDALFGLPRDIRMNGMVDFHAWMEGINNTSGRRGGAAVMVGIAELRFPTCDPGVECPAEIVWKSGIGTGGRDWDMPAVPTEYNLSFEVNHIFNAGNIILFSMGIGNTESGRKAKLLVDGQQQGCSRVYVPWQEEWPQPLPADEGGPLIALVTTNTLMGKIADDLDYLGFSYDIYDDGAFNHISKLFDPGVLERYSAVVVSSGATWSDYGGTEIRDQLDSHKVVLQDYLAAGGGLVVLGQAGDPYYTPPTDYEWLPDGVRLPAGPGGNAIQRFNVRQNSIDRYFAPHPLVQVPDDLLRNVPLDIPLFTSGGNCMWNFSAYRGNPPGTSIDGYTSMATGSFLSGRLTASRTVWIAKEYMQVGRVAVTTMFLDNWCTRSDFISDVTGTPFFDGREAINNMLWWVCKLPYP